MIRLVPVNKNGFSHTIEYDTNVEKGLILTLLGATEAANLKLGRVDRFSEEEHFLEMTHYLNEQGVEVAHSLLHTPCCPHSMAIFKTPRVWADDIKEGFKVVKVSSLQREVRLEIVPEV